MDIKTLKEIALKEATNPVIMAIIAHLEEKEPKVKVAKKK